MQNAEQRHSSEQMPESGPRAKENRESSPETRERTGGEQFIADADTYDALLNKAEEKSRMMRDLSFRLPPGANIKEAETALAAERQSILNSMDKIAETYGDAAHDFRYDVMNINQARLNLAKKQERLDALDASSAGDTGVSEKGMNEVTRMLERQVEERAEQLGALRDLLKKKYDTRVSDGREAMSVTAEGDKVSLAEAEIDAALEDISAKTDAAALEQIADANIDAALEGLTLKAEEIRSEAEARRAQEAATAEALRVLNEDAGLYPADQLFDAEGAKRILSKEQMADMSKESDRKESLRNELAALKAEHEQAKAELDAAEDALRMFDPDIDALTAAKSAEAMQKAFREQMSPWSMLKRGMKFVMNAEYRKALNAYNDKTEALAKKDEDIARTELALRNPLRAAALAARRSMQNMARNASSSNEGRKTLSS